MNLESSEALDLLTSLTSPHLGIGASPQHLDCNVAAYALFNSDWLPGALRQVEIGHSEVLTLLHHLPISTPPSPIRKTQCFIQGWLCYLESKNTGIYLYCSVVP